MRFNHGKRQLEWLNIEKAEEHYPGSKYVGEFCIRQPGGSWSESPVAVFYQPNPNRDLGHTNYFGLIRRGSSVYIMNALSAAEEPFEGILYRDEVIYSRFRHDFRSSSDGRVFVDGGRDYLRWGGEGMAEGKIVRLQIVGSELMVLPEKSMKDLVPAPTENVADAEIKAAYVENFGSDEGWLGAQGSWFIEGYRCGKDRAKQG
jgi:hypothetical protein